MTLLSAQLLKLRQDTSSVLDVDKRKRASILFTPDEAAKVSYEVVLQLAQSGIETLKEIDSTAVEFSISLFGPNTLELERSLLSKEENDILTEKIKGRGNFSLYFLQNRAFKSDVKMCLATCLPNTYYNPFEICLYFVYTGLREPISNPFLIRLKFNH